MQPVDCDTQIGTGKQSGGMRVQAAGQQRQTGRAHGDLPRPPAHPAPCHQAECDHDQQQPWPPQARVAATSEQIDDWIANDRPQRDLGGTGGLGDGRVQRADQQQHTRYYRQAPGARCSDR